MSKGILFSEPTGMLRAVLAGRKTMTRRLGGLEKVNENPDEWFKSSISLNEHWTLAHANFSRHDLPYRVYCKPRYSEGETVYVKEAWANPGNRLFYKIDNTPFENAGLMGMYGFDKWNNPRNMPESAARYFINILSVKVERSTEITENDCIKEGAKSKQHFIEIWDSINGKGDFAENKWVFVYEFELLKNK